MQQYVLHGVKDKTPRDILETQIADEALMRCIAAHQLM